MMSDDSACHDGGERVDAKAMHGYQSAWMSHWMQTRCKSPTPACNPLTFDCKLKEVKEDSDAGQFDLLGRSEVAIGSSMHAGEGGEAAGVTRVKSINEADIGKSKKASFDPKSFPVFEKLDGSLSLQREKNVVYRGEDGIYETKASSGDDNVSLNRGGSHLPSTSAHAPPSTETSVRDCPLLPQGVSPTALLMKFPDAVEQKNLAVSTTVWDNFVKSASDIVPNGRDKGKTVIPQFTCEPREGYQSSYKLASQEHFTSTKYHSYSSLFIHEKKMSSLLETERSSFPRWMQVGIAHFPHDLMAGNDDGLYIARGQHHKIQNYTPNPNIRNQTASSESTKPQNFYGVSSLVAQVPCSVDDMKTMKIYTSIDSVQESLRGHPKISQTTHHFLMSKKTDVNLSERGQFFRESITPTKFKGNAINEILDFSPPMSEHALEGLKPETPGSSRESEGKENVKDFKCPTSQKNESSAETDTMNINALHENNLPGGVPSHTNKCSKDSQNSFTSRIAITSAKAKTIAKSVNTEVPDINKEPHELLTLASPVVDRETSTSRTHSLDVEQLLSHARSKSGSSSLGTDPSSRWVKRLRLCTLDSAHGTRSEKIGEPSPHEKVKNNLSKITKDRNTSLEPKMVDHAEGLMVPDLSATELTNDKSSFTETKKTVEITLSDPWIQRWSHNHAASPQKKQELAELGEPNSSNTSGEEFEKKQFPSIAAMALMGKAMNSLNPSELMKKGPVMVWNAKGF